MVRRTFAVLCLGVLIAGCAADERTQYVRDGVEYGVTETVFRGRWWSYYERGTSFLAGGFHEEALADFEQALKGRTRDSWRARTYGLHFVEYFPNREMGVTLYHLGQFDEAERYLNASLAQIDTERAHYYVDEIKRARIAAGTVQDTAAPVLAAAIVSSTELPAPVFAAPAPKPEPVEPPAVVAMPLPKAEPTPPAPKPEPKPAPEVETKPTPAPAPKVEEAPTPAPEQVAEPKAEEVVVAAAEPEPEVEPQPESAVETEPTPEPELQPEPVVAEAAPAPQSNRDAEMAAAMEAAETLPPAAPTIVAENEVEMAINASDDNGVSCVFVNDEQLYQRGSTEEKEFKKSIDLEEGTHTLEVTGMDLANKAVKQEVEVTVDTTGPTLGVFSPIEPTVTEFGTVILEGATVDKNGVSNVNVDERLLAESPGAPRLPFDTELPLGDGENTFILAARDVAGNETRSAIKVFKGDPDSVQAKLWLIKEKFPERLQFALANPAGITPAFLDSVLAQAEAEKQQIRLKSPALGKPYHHSRSVMVSGDVVTQSGVTSILINGEPFTDLTGAPKESFSRRIPIKPGELVDGKGSKTFTIAATDVKGNTLAEEFTVDIATVGLNDRQFKLPVAVLGFQGFGVADTVPASVQYQLSDSITAAGRFRVVDRSQIQAILQEQQISADLGNPDQAIAIGRIVPAQYYLTGGAFAHERGVEIKARVISTETTEVVDVLDTYVEDIAKAGAIDEACRKLTALFEERFPRLTGSVTAVRGTGGEIMIDLATEDNVRPGAYVLLVYREPDEIDPDSGEVIWPGVDQVVGRARIERVTADGSQAVIVETPEGGAPVEEGMPAVTM